MKKGIIVNTDNGRIIISQLQEGGLSDKRTYSYVLEIHQEIDVPVQGNVRRKYDVTFVEISPGIAKSLREALIEILKEGSK